MIKIKIIYLARLSEDLQKTEELLDFESGKSIRDLYDYLDLGKFSYPIYAAKNFTHQKMEMLVELLFLQMQQQVLVWIFN